MWFCCLILGKKKGKIQGSDVPELVVLLKHRKQNQQEKTIFLSSVCSQSYSSQCIFTRDKVMQTYCWRQNFQHEYNSLIFSPDLSEVRISTSGYQESEWCHLLQGHLQLTLWPVGWEGFGGRYNSITAAFLESTVLFC